MIGDKIMVYDAANDRWFVRWAYKRMYTYANEPRDPMPVWTKDINEAMRTNLLLSAQRVVDKMGGGVRIVSETKARQMEAMKAYREAQRV